MISVIGGKLTTAAELARQCAAKIGVAPKSAPTLAVVSGQSAELLLDRWIVEIGNAGDISETAAHGIVEWHGKRALEISGWLSAAPNFGRPLLPHEHIVAEAVNALPMSARLRWATSCCVACRLRWAAAGRQPAAAKPRSASAPPWGGMTSRPPRNSKHSSSSARHFYESPLKSMLCLRLPRTERFRG